VSGLTHQLLTLAPVWVLALVGLLVFAEDAIFVGFVLPGETAAILGGVDASRGQVPLLAVVLVVCLAAIVGDSVGYEVGRHLGPRLLAARPVRRHAARVGQAQELLARRGGPAVFLGRYVAFFRAVMPALAGSARMRYRTFLAYNAAGGLVWGAAAVLIGYLAGASYPVVERAVGHTSAVLIAAVVIVALATWQVRRRRSSGA
jgi:membrane protein DedA with SNARE-associated domain